MAFRISGSKNVHDYSKHITISFGMKSYHYKCSKNVCFNCL